MKSTYADKNTNEKKAEKCILKFLQTRENTGRFKKTSISNTFLAGHASKNQPRINKLSSETKNEIGTSMASIRKRPKFNK